MQSHVARAPQRYEWEQKDTGSKAPVATAGTDSYESHQLLAISPAAGVGDRQGRVSARGSLTVLVRGSRERNVINASGSPQVIHLGVMDVHRNETRPDEVINARCMSV